MSQTVASSLGTSQKRGVSSRISLSGLMFGVWLRTIREVLTRISGSGR